MVKVEVFFTKSDTFWSKFINLFYKLFYKKITKYTHTGFLFNGKIFEIDLKKESDFYDRKLEKHLDIEIGYIKECEFNKIINKYSGLSYDIDELLILASNNDDKDIDKDFICSTLVAYMLKDLGLLNHYNYETINPDDLLEVIEKEK